MVVDRRQFLHRIGGGAAALGASGWFNVVRAEDKSFSARHITIGSSMPMTGPLGNAGLDHTASVQAAFADINRAGGIHGRELRFVCKDDGYAPPRTAANIKEMLEAESVFAMMSIIGTANTGAVLPMTEKAGIPVLGPITGAASLRKPEFRSLFHIRPSYTDEVTRMVQQLVQMGIQDIAVVYLDNPFGKEVLGNAQAALGQSNLKAVAAIPLAGDGKNAAEATQQLLDSKAGAVFLGATGTGVTDFVLAVRQKASGIPIIGLSVTFTDTKRLGKAITGLAMASVFPTAKSRKFALVRSYWASVEGAGANVEGLGVESWVNAQILAEGLRRAGRDLTRDKLRAALAGIRGYDVGEVAVNFTNASPYVATKSVKLGIFDPEGILRT
jgi:branched-chain amino acid transport system substrate-binding protein